MKDKKIFGKPVFELIPLGNADIITTSEKVPDIEKDIIVTTNEYKFTVSS